MNPYYLSTEALSYGFGNGYSSGSGTSSPAAAAAGIDPATVGSGGGASPADAGASASGATGVPAAGPSGNGEEPSSSGGNGNGNGSAAPLAGPLVTPHQDLNDFLESFWTRQMDGVEGETPDFKTYNLPLARIKKVMKSDEEVKMISAEAPIMFSKACEIFISELTCRAWLVAEGHKRRTLQKSDVASAIAFSDVFDFLIDIVPRDDGTEASASAPPAATSTANSVPDAGGEAPDATADWTVGATADGTAAAEEREGDALYSEYVQGEGEAFA